MMTILDIKQDSYFPFTFKLFAIILGLFGVLIWTQPIPNFVKPIITMISWLVAFLMFTSRYGIRIDPEEKSYLEYVWVLGFRQGKTMPFGRIDRIFINKVKDTATVQNRAGASYDVSKDVYKAFLKFDNGEKVHLDTDKKRERLEGRVADYERLLMTKDQDKNP